LPFYDHANYDQDQQFSHLSSQTLRISRRSKSGVIIRTNERRTSVQQRFNRGKFELVSTRPRVVILLATRNGSEFLGEQLASYCAQTYPNWELLVSDDGSTDETVAMIKNFAMRVPQRVAVRYGPQLGFWQNFISLVRSDDIDGDLFAYSDQDDIWFAEKLANAVSWFEARRDEAPALYFTRTELIDADGTAAGFSPIFTRPPTFRNALVQNIGGGNTMVFNRAARSSLRATAVDALLVAHDWWTYQVVTGVGGVAHYDPGASLKYRQHGQNLIGSNIGFRARLDRLSAFANGRVVMWNDINLKVLEGLRNMLTPQNAVVLDCFSKARRASWPRRLWFVWKSGVYRQSVVETIGLYVGALLDRL
jgi:glycosyltransferase involved in cell wall biosynthesis